MKILWPSGTREQIEAMIGEIGRDVDFFVPTVSACFNCSLDPITNTSTDSFCPVCSGVYWIPEYDKTTISGHIVWKYYELDSWQTGGHVFRGDGTIKIMFTEDNYRIATDADHMLADGKILLVDKVTVRGVPEINRIIIDFKEKE